MVKVDGKVIKELKEIKTDGWIWQSLQQGGVLRIKQSKGNRIEIIK